MIISDLETMGEREPLLRPSIVTVQLEYDSIEQVILVKKYLVQIGKNIWCR